MIDWGSLAVWFYLMFVIASAAWLLGKYAEWEDERSE